MDEDDGVRDNTVTHSPTNSQQTGNYFRHPKLLQLFLFHFHSSCYLQLKMQNVGVDNYQLSLSTFNLFHFNNYVCSFHQNSLFYWFDVKVTDYFLTLIACFPQFDERCYEIPVIEDHIFASNEFLQMTLHGHNLPCSLS